MVERVHCHIHVPLYYYYSNTKSSTLSKKYVDCLNDVMQSYDDFYDRCKGRSVTTRVIDILKEQGALEFNKHKYIWNKN